MFGGGKNAHTLLVERIDMIESNLMSNIHRFPTVENKNENLHKIMMVVETRLDREFQRRQLAADDQEAETSQPAGLPMRRRLPAWQQKPHCSQKGKISNKLRPAVSGVYGGGSIVNMANDECR